MNVLFVEDSLPTQKLIAGTTATAFPMVKLTCCETLEQAKQLVSMADVIVLDLGLPGSTHEDVFDWISECGKPVVIYTASTTQDVAIEAVRAGAMNVVCKGSPAEQLVIGLYVAIAEHQLLEDERSRRREIAERLHDVLSKWCRVFADTLSCGNAPQK